MAKALKTSISTPAGSWRGRQSRRWEQSCSRKLSGSHPENRPGRELTGHDELFCITRI